MKLDKTDIMVYSGLILAGTIGIYFVSKQIIALKKRENDIKNALNDKGFC